MDGNIVLVDGRLEEAVEIAKRILACGGELAIRGSVTTNAMGASTYQNLKSSPLLGFVNTNIEIGQNQ